MPLPTVRSYCNIGLLLRASGRLTIEHENFAQSDQQRRNESEPSVGFHEFLRKCRLLLLLTELYQCPVERVLRLPVHGISKEMFLPRSRTANGARTRDATDGCCKRNVPRRRCNAPFTGRAYSQWRRECLTIWGDACEDFASAARPTGLGLQRSPERRKERTRSAGLGASACHGHQWIRVLSASRVGCAWSWCLADCRSCLRIPTHELTAPRRRAAVPDRRSLTSGDRHHKLAPPSPDSGMTSLAAWTLRIQCG
jgi:hypothetical protein